MPKKHISKIEKATNLPTEFAPFASALNIFKINKSNQLVFKSKSEIKSNAIGLSTNRYSINQINAVMKNTNLLFIDPKEIDDIEKMLGHAWNGSYIPTFYGKVENSVSGDEKHILNYKTLNFGVFTGAMTDRTNRDFLFAYLSQSEDEYALDSELEGFQQWNGITASIVDELNDMFGVVAGTDYGIVFSIKIHELPEFTKLLGVKTISKPVEQIKETNNTHLLQSEKVWGALDKEQGVESIDASEDAVERITGVFLDKWGMARRKQENNEWTAITDELPPYDEDGFSRSYRLMVCVNKNTVIEAHYYGRGEFYLYNGSLLGNVTHWMLQPKAPK